MYKAKQTMPLHRAGRLSLTGVLDVGRKCPHSCVFCFYSFYDGSDEQFHYLRHAQMLPFDKLKLILDHFKEWGLTNFDYTGGEPSVHPEIVRVTEYAHKTLGLRGRMITLAQFFQKRFRGSSMTLLEELLDAGLNDFLFSFHTADEALFHEITGGRLQNMKETMSRLDRVGFSYCTNSTVSELNYHTLPETAEYLVRHNIRIANFIMMRMDWGLRQQPGIAVKTKGSYSEVVPYVKRAIDVLESNGIAVNVRYAPMCTFKGYERHIVGAKGIQLDAYEWRNGTLAASEGVPFLKNLDEESYYKDRVPLFETDPVYNLGFGEPCGRCALRAICDGVDKTYTERYGWEEFVPYEGDAVTDIVHYRYDYPGPFYMKIEQFDTEAALDVSAV